MWWKNNPEPEAHNSASQLLSEMQSNGVSLSVEELLAYQRKASLLNLTPGKSLVGHMAGNYLAKTKGRGMEFDEVRHYQPGDDVRAIDWRVTARTGKTHTKLYREEIERPILIATDLSHSMLFGSKLLFKSVQAAHIASLIAWHAKGRGDRVGGIVFNDLEHEEIKPRTRQKGVLAYLHALSTIHDNSLSHWRQNRAENSDAFFEQNCMRLRQLAKPGSLIYLLSDIAYISEEAVRQLVLITQHCELVVCHITDPLEYDLPDVDSKVNVAITDGQIKQQLTLGDRKLASEYHSRAEDWHQTRVSMLTRSGIKVIHFCAGKPIEEQLVSGAL